MAAIRHLTHGEGAHKTLAASSAPEARAAAVRSVRSRGAACFVAQLNQALGKREWVYPPDTPFGPGQLPSFNTDFFKMPRGRTEDWVLIEFRDKLMATHGDDRVDRDQMWEELREKVEASLEKRSSSEDAGMDRGV